MRRCYIYGDVTDGPLATDKNYGLVRRKTATLSKSENIFLSINYVYVAADRVFIIIHNLYLEPLTTASDPSHGEVEQANARYK